MDLFQGVNPQNIGGYNENNPQMDIDFNEAKKKLGIKDAAPVESAEQKLQREKEEFINQNPGMSDELKTLIRTKNINLTDDLKNLVLNNPTEAQKMLEATPATAQAAPSQQPPTPPAAGTTPTPGATPNIPWTPGQTPPPFPEATQTTQYGPQQPGFPPTTPFQYPPGPPAPDGQTTSPPGPTIPTPPSGQFEPPIVRYEESAIASPFGTLPPEEQAAEIQRAALEKLSPEERFHHINKIAQEFKEKTKKATDLQMEKRYGKGWRGLWGLKRWLGESRVGKVLSIGAKILGGAALYVGSKASFLTGIGGLILAPIADIKGRQLMVQGGIEAFNYFCLGGRKKRESMVESRIATEKIFDRQIELLNQEVMVGRISLSKAREILADYEKQRAINETTTQYWRKEYSQWEAGKKPWETWLSVAGSLGWGLFEGISFGMQDFDQDKVKHAVKLYHDGFKFVGDFGKHALDTQAIFSLGYLTKAVPLAKGAGLKYFATTTPVGWKAYAGIAGGIVGMIASLFGWSAKEHADAKKKGVTDSEFYNQAISGITTPNTGEVKPVSTPPSGDSGGSTPPEGWPDTVKAWPYGGGKPGDENTKTTAGPNVEVMPFGSSEKPPIPELPDKDKKEIQEFIDDHGITKDKFIRLKDGTEIFDRRGKNKIPPGTHEIIDIKPDQGIIRLSIDAGDGYKREQVLNIKSLVDKEENIEILSSSGKKEAGKQKDQKSGEGQINKPYTEILKEKSKRWGENISDFEKDQIWTYDGKIWKVARKGDIVIYVFPINKHGELQDQPEPIDIIKFAQGCDWTDIIPKSPKPQSPKDDDKKDDDNKGGDRGGKGGGKGGKQ